MFATFFHFVANIYFSFIHFSASFNQLSHCQDPPHTPHHRWSFWSDVVHLLWATSWCTKWEERFLACLLTCPVHLLLLSLLVAVAVQRRCSFTINGLFVLVQAAAACSAPHFHSYEWNSQISLLAGEAAGQQTVLTYVKSNRENCMLVVMVLAPILTLFFYFAFLHIKEFGMIFVFWPSDEKSAIKSCWTDANES